jgi:hypothetical protein
MAQQLREATRFEEKYGSKPNLVYANPQTAEAQTLNGITVKQARSILPNHFWLGIADQGGAA